MSLESYTTDEGTFYRDKRGPTAHTTTKQEILRGIEEEQIPDYLVFFSDATDTQYERFRRKGFRARQRHLHSIRKSRKREQAPLKPLKTENSVENNSVENSVENKQYCDCDKPFECVGSPPSTPLREFPEPNNLVTFTRLTRRIEATRAWVSSAQTKKERRKRERFLVKKGHEAERLRLLELQDQLDGIHMF